MPKLGSLAKRQKNVLAQWKATALRVEGRGLGEV